MRKSSVKQQGLLWRLAQAQSLKRLVPRPLKYLGRRLLPLESYDPQKWLAEDPYAKAEAISTYPAKVDATLGIIREFTRIHSFYIGACRELGVPYKVIDISGPDWLKVTQNASCDAFLVRPPGQITVWKQMFDERLRIMSQALKQTLYPSYEEIWFYESKRRMHYWLAAHDVAHAQTWVFYDRAQAHDFVAQATLPLVFKTDFGSGAMGVRILHDRDKLHRLVDRCFRKGIVKAGGDRRDRQWGSILLQAYLPQVKEWRMIRIGDAYMGYQKLQKGDYHSGSHAYVYGVPPTELLDWVKAITDRGGFRSMALDIFVTATGEFLVNELQTTFKIHVEDGLPMKDGKPGCFVYDQAGQRWRFKQGDFCRNQLCNLRVQDLLQQLHCPLSDEPAADLTQLTMS